jgi:glutamine amidotransferase-like uncharacterized protein
MRNKSAQLSTFKIAVYSDPITELRTEYLNHALKRDLPRMINGIPTELLSLNLHDFSRVASQMIPDVIFIPENMHSISHHMRDFTPETIKALGEYVTNGGLLVLFGGASHYAMENIIWYWDNGEAHYKGAKETFSFVSGTLTGPHHIHLPDILHFNGCFEVPLNVLNEQDKTTTEMCWQGNCGAFDVDLSVHENSKILAYYKEIDSKHIAAIEIPQGSNGGKLILCSTMPHYRTRQESSLWNKILSRIENKIPTSHISSTVRNVP